jgi:hypothetical protein
MGKPWLTCFFLLVLFSIAPRSRAATLEAPPNLREMVVQAHAIFLGTCETSVSRWDDATRTIFTDSTFAVAQYLKSDLGPSITLTEPGGVLPQMNLMMVVPHVPQFHIGEEVVVFVWTDPQGTHQVLGAAQGKYSVQIAPATGDKVVQGVPLAAFLQSIAAQVSGFQKE